MNQVEDKENKYRPYRESWPGSCVGSSNCQLDGFTGEGQARTRRCGSSWQELQPSLTRVGRLEELVSLSSLMEQVKQAEAIFGCFSWCLWSWRASSCRSPSSRKGCSSLPAAFLTISLLFYLQTVTTIALQLSVELNRLGEWCIMFQKITGDRRHWISRPMRIVSPLPQREKT